MDEFAKFMEVYLQLVQQLSGDLSDEEIVVVEEFIFEAMKLFLAKQQEEMPTEAPIVPIPEIPTGGHPSSNIEGFKYSPDNKELLVQFHGPYPQSKGPIYSYQGVPAYIFDVISRGAVGPKTTGSNRYHAWQKGITPSLGASVYSLIKNAGYPYQKVA